MDIPPFLVYQRDMSLISNTKDLKTFCNSLKKAEFIKVDT